MGCTKEHVALAHVFEQLHLEAVVGEALHLRLAQRNVERGTHRLRELLATCACENADRLHSRQPTGGRNAASRRNVDCPMTNITVLGGTGYTGAAIVSEALKRGHSVTVVSRSAPESPVDGVTYVTGSALDCCRPRQGL